MGLINKEQLDNFVNTVKPRVDVQVEGKRAKVQIGDRKPVVLRTDIGFKESQELAKLTHDVDVLQAVTVGKVSFDTWSVVEVSTLVRTFYELFEALQGVSVGE